MGKEKCMCGICGIVNFNVTDRVAPDLLQRMTSAQAHRGPDDQGYFVENNVGLGHRRLSIIDLSGGKQPIFNEDGSVVVVFNGEIYNFADLTADLISRGHQFKTRSDTETIVHAYEEYGFECMKDFRGMLAFALSIPNCASKHPPKGFHALKAILFVGVNDRFGIGTCFELVSARDEIGREIGKVIDLAVENDDNGTVLIEDRLLSAAEVNDAEAAMPEPDIVLDKVAMVIRSAVLLSGCHPLKHIVSYPVSYVEIDDPANPAHKLFLPALLFL